MSEAGSQRRRRSFKQGDRVRASVERLIPKGGSLARVNGSPVRVQGGVPGDELEVLITHTGKNASWAKLEAVITPSTDRVEAPCSVMSRCGGCPWQTSASRLQRDTRRGQVDAILAAYLDDKVISHGWLSTDRSTGYRTRATMILRHRGGRLRLGFYAPGTQDIIDAEPCVVQHPALNRMLERARQSLEDASLPSWRSAERPGFLRALSGRLAPTDETGFLTLVVSHWDEDAIRHAGNLLLAIDGVVGVAINVNPYPSGPILSPDTRPLVGRDRQLIRWRDLALEVGPTSFVQTRHDAAESLIEFIAEVLPERMNHLVDLYAGVGMFGLSYQGRAARVTCVERNPGSVADARRYVTEQGLTHVEVREAKVSEVVSEVLVPGVDVVILDPPRSGCPTPVIDALVMHPVEQVIYLSCGLNALERDIPRLVKEGYTIAQVAFFDMFPHTPHAEVAVVLSRQGSS